MANLKGVTAQYEFLKAALTSALESISEKLKKCSGDLAPDQNPTDRSVVFATLLSAVDQEIKKLLTLLENVGRGLLSTLDALDCRETPKGNEIQATLDNLPLHFANLREEIVTNQQLFFYQLIHTLITFVEKNKSLLDNQPPVSLNRETLNDQIQLHHVILNDINEHSVQIQTVIVFDKEISDKKCGVLLEKYEALKQQAEKKKKYLDQTMKQLSDFQLEVDHIDSWHVYFLQAMKQEITDLVDFNSKINAYHGQRMEKLKHFESAQKICKVLLDDQMYGDKDKLSGLKRSLDEKWSSITEQLMELIVTAANLEIESYSKWLEKTLKVLEVVDTPSADPEVAAKLYKEHQTFQVSFKEKYECVSDTITQYKVMLRYIANREPSEIQTQWLGIEQKMIVVSGLSNDRMSVLREAQPAPLSIEVELDDPLKDGIEVDTMEEADNATSPKKLDKENRDSQDKLEDSTNDLTSDQAMFDNKVEPDVCENPAILPDQCPVASLITTSSSPALCPLCPADMIKPTKRAMILKHMDFHVHHSFCIKGKRFLICRLHCLPSGRSHYHCMCGKVTRIKKVAEIHSRHCSIVPKQVCSEFMAVKAPTATRTASIRTSAALPTEAHAVTYGPGDDVLMETDARIEGTKRHSNVKTYINAPADIRTSEDFSATAPASAYVFENMESQDVFSLIPKRKRPTVICPICTKRVSRSNIRRHVKTHASPDLGNGVCVCLRDGIYLVESAGQPIHIISKMYDGDMKFICCQTDCQLMTGPSNRGRQNYMCKHVLSSLNLPNTVIPVEVPDVSDMNMSETMKQSVRELANNAVCSGKTLMVKWPDTSLAQYFSVFTGKVRYWSPFGRTVVSVKSASGIHCPCSGKHNCVHKALVRMVVGTCTTVPENDSDDCKDPADSLDPDVDIKPSPSMNRWLTYLSDQPIQVGQDLRDHLMSTAVVRLSPREQHCPWCSGSLCLKTATKDASVVDISFIRRGIHVFYKECTECQEVIRYRGNGDGLMSFNNSVILTLQLCRWLLCSVKCHTAISTELLKLEDFHSIKYPPHDVMMKAFLRFVALTDHSYAFTCIECGIYPPVLITDVNKKCCFRLKGSDIGGATNASDVVDMEKFWLTVREQIIAGKKVSEMLPPSYDNWAPYIGAACNDTLVYNTEFMKVAPPGPIGTDDDDNILNEDYLIELMTEKNLSEVKKVCRSLQLSAKGTKLDCLERLRRKLASKDTYNKVFTKFAGSSGGLLCACCPHGVVYGIKFLLRGESPRDHVDMLLSFSCQPTLTVCDIPGFVASHGNKRKIDMFHPNKGRFAEESDDNISAYHNGKLSISLPELDLGHLAFSHGHTDTDHSYASVRHPVTQSTNHYCGYDRFHEENSTVEVECLRRLDTVPQLSFLNSQVVEEFFSRLNRSNYFLTQMSPIHHIFVVRLLCHLHNEDINHSIRKKLEKCVRESLPGCTISEGPDRRLIVAGHIPEDTTKSHTKPCKHPDQETFVGEGILKRKKVQQTDDESQKKIKVSVDDNIGSSSYVPHRGQHVVRLHDIPTWMQTYQTIQGKFKTPVGNCTNTTIDMQLNTKVSVFKGDITTLQVDAIVNAAKTSLLGGGGVDGAIHKAAGPRLLEECVKLRGCNTGEAKITAGFDLPARYVIHAVGPVGSGDQELQSCYRASLKLLLARDLQSVAFPCISTGIYGFPSDRAACIALAETRRFLEETQHKIERVIFCVHGQNDWDLYITLLQKYFPVQNVSRNNTQFIQRPVIMEIIQTVAQDTVLARHGPYLLTAVDFTSLSNSNWLTDNVVDAYLHMTAKDHTDIYVMANQTLTSILDGFRGPVLLRNLKITQFRMVVGVYHQGGAHWTSLLFHETT